MTAKSNLNGAGIGCGVKGTCGNITIFDSTVLAQSEGNAAGIGCGMGEEKSPSICGDIYIIKGKNTDFSVTAIRGSSAVYPIGLFSKNSKCNSSGTIFFGGSMISRGGIDSNYDSAIDRYNDPYLLLTISSSSPGNSGKKNNTWTLTPK